MKSYYCHRCIKKLSFDEMTELYFCTECIAAFKEDTLELINVAKIGIWPCAQ